MSRRSKTLLVVSLLLLGGGLAVLLIYLFRSREPGPDDVAGWTAKERLEIKSVPLKEGQMSQLLIYGIDFGGQLAPPVRDADRGTRKDMSRLPTTYYHRHGPIGVIFERWNWGPEYWTWPTNTWHADARLPASLVGLALADTQTAGALPAAGAFGQVWTEPPIAVVGIMGAGVLAAYARPYQFVDFYELSPAIIQMSVPKAGVAKFTFVEDATKRGANVRIFQGAARRTLEEKGPDSFYQVMVIEPSRINDAPTAELLTREALELFFQKAREDGILAFHTSNRHFDMDLALADVAAHKGFVCYTGHHALNDPERSIAYTSEWAMLARKEGSLLPYLIEPIFDEGEKRITYADKAREHARRQPEFAPPGPFWSPTPIMSRGARVLIDGDLDWLNQYRRRTRE